MANDTPSDPKIKDDENGISKGGRTGGNGVTSSSTEIPYTSNLRRSSSKKKTTSGPSSSKNISETPLSNKHTSPIPLSIQKPEHLEKQNFATPAAQWKLERVEKQTLKIPMRGSERGKMPSSPSYSGSKNSNKSLGLSEMKREREKRKKSVKQLSMETEAVSCISEKQDAERVQVPKKRISAQSYRALLKRPKKLELKVECCTVESGTLDDIGLERGQYDMPLKRKRDTETVSHAYVEVAGKETCDSLIDVAPSSPTRCTKIMCGDKKQRVDSDSTEQEILSCPSTSKENSGRHIHDTSIAKDRGGDQVGGATELAEMSKHQVQQNGLHVDISACVDEDTDVSKNVAYGSTLNSSRFSEYWVPVQISDAQLEWYCATFLSNSLLLCSPAKHDAVGALHDILMSTQKCCDHPYIVDKSFTGLLRKGLELTEYLDADIKASGKLQLLDTMLSELKKQGSKVVVLFQSTGGGRDSLSVGDLLDDFVCQRFGADSYERLDGNVLDSKKKSALKNFNKGSERFVFLSETCACRPSIKVSSVHAVIIFHSDWSPQNDLKALQKITLDSQLELIKVFRFYLSCTVEEKVLVLAKQGKIPDRYIQKIKPRTIHILLMWGASYLFNRLDEFHSGNISASSSSKLFEQSLKTNVLQEFLTILNQTENDNVTSQLNVISEVNQNLGTYSTTIPLFGESIVEAMDEEHPYIFWKNLLEGKHPLWKYYSGSSQGNRKKFKYCDDLQKTVATDNDDTIRNHRKVAKISVNQSSFKPGVGGKVAKEKEGTSAPAGKIDWWDSASTLGNSFSDISRDSKHSLKGLHLSLKSNLEKLGEILQLREDVKDTAEKFLEYVMTYVHVDGYSETVLQAFLISLCWTAASLQKQKIGHKESLSLAVKHLHFSCKKTEADYINSLLQCLKGVFEFSGKDVSKYQSNEKLEVDDRSTGQVCFEKHDLFKVAQKDLLTSIKGIHKKCRKRFAKVHQKIQKEEEGINKRYEEGKTLLESKKKIEGAVIRILSHGKMQTDELKELDNVCAEKFEELIHERDVGLEKLKAYDADVEKVRYQETSWVEQVRSWLSAKLSNKPSENEFGCNVERVPAVEEHNARENSIPNSVHISEIQNPTGSVNLITIVSEEGRVESSMIKEIMPSEVVACSNPFETIDGPHRLDMEVDQLDAIASGDTSIAGLKEQIEAGNGSNNQENDVRLGPCSREQILGEAMLSMRDKHSQLEVAETSSSDDAGDFLPPLHSSGEKRHVEARLSPKGQVPEEVDKTVSCKVGTETSGSVSAPSSEDRIPDAATTSMSRVVLLRVPEAASFSIFTENFIDPPFVQQIDSGSISAMPGEVVPLRVPENVNVSDGLENVVLIDPSSKEQNRDGAISNIRGAEFLRVHEADSSNNCTENFIDLPPPEEVPLRVSKNVSTGDGVENVVSVNPPSKQQNHGVATSSIPSAEILLRVRESSAGEILVNSDITGDNDEGYATTSGNANQNLRLFEPSLINPPSLQNQTAIETGPLPSNLALQDLTSEPTTLTGVQRRDEAGGELQNPLVTETSSPHTVNALTSNQSNHVPAPTEPVVIGANEPVFSGVGHQPSSEHCFDRQFDRFPTQMVESQGVVLCKLTLPEHVSVSTINPPTYSIERLGTHSVEIRSGVSSDYINRTAQDAATATAQSPQYMFPDPLQKEVERLHNAKAEVSRIHEESKLKMKSDCERELDEVRRKYQIKAQEEERWYLQTKQELDANENKVLMNKIVAETIRTKWVDMKASSVGVQQEVSCSPIHQQLPHMLSQHSAQRPVSACSSAPPTASVQTTVTPVANFPITSLALSQRTAVPTPHLSAVFSSTPRPPPQISSRVLPFLNHQLGRGLRAPAPHLQPFRPSTTLQSPVFPSIPSNPLQTSLSSPTVPSSVFPSTPSNPMSMSLPLPQHPRPPSLATHSAFFYNRAPVPEASGVEPSLPNPSMYASNLVMDFDIRSGGTQTAPSSFRWQSDFGSNVPIVEHEANLQNGIRANPAQMSGAGDIVCLSDDD